MPPSSPPSPETSATQPKSANFANLAYRYGVLILIALLVAVWSWKALAPQELFRTESERQHFLDTIGAPHSTRIIILVTEWCPACKQLDQSLSEKGVPYLRLDIERDRNAHELFTRVYKIAGSNSIPKVILDRNVVSRGQLYLEIAGWKGVTDKGKPPQLPTGS